MAADSHLSLEDLIRAVEVATPDGDELERITEAAQLKFDVDALTDALVGHFVELARAAGCSWSHIGEALGVSKQAAQQRHGERPADEPLPRWRGRMFSRFTERTKGSLDQAREAAAELGHNYIGTEHLLLGLLRTPGCVAAIALEQLGVSAQGVERAVLDIIGRGGSPRGRRPPPFTPRSKKALEVALREALGLGHNYIGTEHLLLALLRMEEGVAYQVLVGEGITADAVRAKVVEVLLLGPR